MWNNYPWLQFFETIKPFSILIQFQTYSIAQSKSSVFRYHIVRLTIWHQIFLEFWLVDTWFFAHPCDQRAVTRLENVHQLNTRRGKKLGLQLSHIDNLILENWSVFHYLWSNSIYEDFAKTSKALLHFLIKFNLLFSYHSRP